MSRRGLRVCDLMNTACFREKFGRLAAEKDAICRAAFGKPLELSGIVEQYESYAERLRPYVADTSALVNRAIADGKRLLLEGAQGTMLDIDHGTYPFVTSSNSTAGGACTGLGLPPHSITGVAGITKAYTTRVGSGPFPTEMPDLEASDLRQRGKEFGAVTGRPRRCGWLDLVILRYAIQVNGIDSLVVTKLDVFDAQREIQICTGYRYKGSPLSEMPPDFETLEKVTPEYRTLPGWMAPTSSLQDPAALPAGARDYLKFISDTLGVEIGMISTGPEREATFLLPGTKLASWL